MEACSLLVNLRIGMQGSSEQPLVGEEHCVTTVITAAKETMVTLTTQEMFVSVFRIMLCAMCGDPYPVELILGPLLHHQNCWRSSTRPDTIILETYLGFDKKRVQITLTSYHRKWCSCDLHTQGSLTGVLTLTQP